MQSHSRPILHSFFHSRLCFYPALCLLPSALLLPAQVTSIDWFTFDTGSASSTSAACSVSGSVGQPTVAHASSSNCILESGFWSCPVGVLPPETNSPIQIVYTATNTIVVSWPIGPGTWVLQSSPTGEPGTWTDVTALAMPVDGRMQVVLPDTEAGKQFRLVQPPAPIGQPCLRAPSFNNGRFTFTFDPQSNVTYRIQYAAELLQPYWVTVFSATGSNQAVTYSESNRAPQTGFYRMLAGEPTNAVIAGDLRAVAGGIYDQIDQGQAFRESDLEMLFSGFGIPVISSTNGQLFQSKVDAHEPFMLDVQLELISGKMTNSFYVTVDSLIAELANQGATAISGLPLTRAYLNSQMAPLLSRELYAADEMLPGLVMALGRERAVRIGLRKPDPVWGDGLLDPIQYHLLLYSFVYCSATNWADAAMGSPRLSTPGQVTLLPAHVWFPLVPWAPTLSDLLNKHGPKQLRMMLTAFLGKLIEFPLGPLDTAAAGACASVVLYSYQVQMTIDQNNLWHRTDPPEHPDLSKIQAVVNFHFPRDPDSYPKEITLWWGRCELPIDGPQDNLEVQWELTEELPRHGSFTLAEPRTWMGGIARAWYQTISETVPKVFRSAQVPKQATGVVTARVLNLLKNWSKLEVALRNTNPDIGAGHARLFVNYYEWPELKLEFQSQVTGGPLSFVADLVATLSLQRSCGGNPNTGEQYCSYEGSVLEQYRSFTGIGDGSDWVITQLIPGTMSVKIPYQSDAADFKIYVDIGKPQEVILVFAGGITPSSVFEYTWRNAHASEMTDPPFACIQGWQSDGKQVLTKQCNGSAPNGFNEATSLRLVLTPPP